MDNQEDELKRLRLLLDEARRQRDEENRRRQDAEKAAQSSQPQSLQDFLKSCHELSLAIKVITEPSSTTQGDTTNPTGRIYPQQIVRWQSFPSEQEAIWNVLSTGSSFPSDPVFPSSTQLDYVKTLIRPISSELGLRDFERDTVENIVRKLFDATYNDKHLRSELDLNGTLSFESHTNLGEIDESLTSSMEAMSVGAHPRQPAAPRIRRKARGKGNRADQFCIYEDAFGQKVPAVAIEYKPPHKLSRDTLVTGLSSNIQPEKDIIHQSGEGFEFAAQRLSAAVITQLFSYMIGKGVQYGYICTGEVIVFLHIPDDPAVVEYYICIPNEDVMDDDEAKLQRTAVSQIFAFVLQAVRAEPPPAAWHDAAEKLGIWAVEYDDVLKNIPPSERKPVRASPYVPSRWKGFSRSPIRTRSRCKPHGDDSPQRDNDDDDEGNHSSPSPSPTPGPHARFAQKISRVSQTRGQRNSQRHTESSTGKTRVHDRPYCSQECLSGLARGGSMDRRCPNLRDHRKKHPKLSRFIQLIRGQLAYDRGRNADCAPLYLSGALGALFKVRLSSHGYTFVAKGMERLDLDRLQHEAQVYARLEPLQGLCVPVLLGMVELVLPYYYDHGVFTHFMLLSHGGRPLFDRTSQDEKQTILRKIDIAYQKIHRLGVLHRDAEARNLLYDERRREVMVIDFERSALSDMKEPVHSCRLPLGELDSEQIMQRKKNDLEGLKSAHRPGKPDCFQAELNNVRHKVVRILG